MTIDQVAIAAAGAWIVRTGLSSDDPAELLTGLSEQLLAAGVPVMRAHISFATLDPYKRTENVVWLRGGGTTREFHTHEEFERAFPRSPFPEMLRTGQMRRRWRLDAPEDAEGFPVIEAMQRSGAKDLVVRMAQFAGTADVFQGVAISSPQIVRVASANPVWGFWRSWLQSWRSQLIGLRHRTRLPPCFALISGQVQGATFSVDASGVARDIVSPPRSSSRTSAALRARPSAKDLG